MSSPFQHSLEQKKGTLGHLVTQIRRSLDQAGGSFVSDKRSVSRVLSMESLDEHAQGQFDISMGSLKSSLSEIASVHCKALESFVTDVDGHKTTTQPSFTNAQLFAAQIAATMCADVPSWLSREIGKKPQLEGLDDFYADTSAGSIQNRLLGSQKLNALEAYDEKENKETTVYSVLYNMQAATQDEFGEALFPTCVVTPDQYGLTISMRLVMVMDDLRRETSGAMIRDFNRKNIIRAMIDPEILHNDMTKIFPVVRDEALANFVDPALVPATTIIHEGVSIDTAPLLMGAQFDLLGISQTDALIATGTLDTTDAIDPNIVLDSLYMSVAGTVGGTATTEVIKISSVGQMIGSTFNAAPQGNYRQQMLNFVTDSLPINSKTKQADGAVSVLLAAPIAAGVVIKLAVTVSGNVNLQTAETSIMAGKIKVASITDSTGKAIDMTTGTGLTYANLFNTAVVFGYDLDARRVNTNRRERGQLLDITYQNVIYGVPLLSPITAPRPPAGPQQDEANYLAGLITTTRVRTSNAAVARLLETEAALNEFVTNNLGDDEIVKPEILGVGGWLIKAVYENQQYVAPQIVDSLKSYERAADIQASLVNLIRDMALRLYRESGYKAAANAMHGGVAPMPTVIIATDTMIAGYLQVTGDFRTLGNEFNVKVVSTTNKLMKNKIRFSFGVFGEGKENAPNPLHFGVMAWKPEITLILPTVRNGSNSREISVSPSFRHIVNLPLMGSIDVSGITDVVNKKVNVNTSPTVARQP